MLYQEAKNRIIKRNLPDFWFGDYQKYIELINRVQKGKVTEIARSPGNRPLYLVSYGRNEDLISKANYGSAVAGNKPEAYLEKAKRKKPVIFFLGPVHGHEVEGITGLMNLINILETGYDLQGKSRKEISSLARKCRLLIIPVGNPDGFARFEAGSLQNMEMKDLRFWGQGVWLDGTLCGYPECKRVHPMPVNELDFTGCYFNDSGINIIHDEFFNPMTAETKNILQVAQKEGPDLAISLHSHEYPPSILKTRCVDKNFLEKTRQLEKIYYNRLQKENLPAGKLIDLKPDNRLINLTSAIHHISGANSFSFECAHGLKDYCQVSFYDILEIELLLFQTVMEFELGKKF